MTERIPPAFPPFCEVHGCRGRWDADQPHTLCGKAPATAAGRWGWFWRIVPHPCPIAGWCSRCGRYASDDPVAWDSGWYDRD